MNTRLPVNPRFAPSPLRRPRASFAGRGLGYFDPTTATDVVMDDGTDFYVDAGGNVARLVAGQWVQDDITTPTIQQAVQAMGPPTVQQAAANAQAQGTGFTGFTQQLMALVPQFMQAKAQNQLMNINLQRAQQGLPPIDASKYTPGLQVGATSDTQRTALIIAGILGGAYVLSSLARR